MREFAALQQAFSRFASIPPDQWELLLRGTRFLEVPKGELLQRQGEPAEWLGFLESGLVRSFLNMDGREVNLGFDFEGGFVGAYDAYMQRARAQYAVQTLEDSTVLRFDRALLDELIAGHVCWRELSGRVAESELVRKLNQEVEARTRSPEERYAEMVRAEPRLVRRIPQYHLASYLGIAPETLSRIRARMA